MKNTLIAFLVFLLVEGLFAQEWNASLEGKTIPAGGALSSLYRELPDEGEFQWNIQCDGELSIEVEFYDILGQVIERRRVSGVQGRLTPSPLAAGFVINVLNDTSRPLQIGVVEAGSGAGNRKFTQAEWIWEPTLGEKSGAYAIFRTNFKIDDIGSIQEAFLYITADDRVVAYLNDVYLEGPHSGGYDESDSFQVKRALRNGDNVLTCRVLNGGGPGGLLCELHMRDRSGAVTVIPSSSEWRCVPVAAEEDWRNAPAVAEPIVLGKNGVSPWGQLGYMPVTQYSATVALLNIPEMINENTKWAPEVLIDFLEQEKIIGADVELSIRLKNEKNNILIAEKILAREELESAGNEMRLTLAPVHFRYIPDGEYSLGVSLPNAKFAVETPRVTVRRSAEAPLGLPRATIVHKDTIPQFVIDGNEMRHITQYLVDNAMSAKAFREYKRAFGANVQTLWIHHAIQFDQEGNPDFSNLDNICNTCLARNPEICIVVNPALDCVQSPQMTKFFEEHPDALCRNSEGDAGIYNDPAAKYPVKCNCMASEAWLQEAERLLGLLIDHLEKTPFGRRVVAIAPSSGITWEWMYWGCERLDECTDYSRTFLDAFKIFALKKYSTIEKANQAWKTNFKSFEDIAIPGREECFKKRDSDLALPEYGTILGDFALFKAETISGDIIRLCSFIKERTQGRSLTCVYYGYYNMITTVHWAQGSGHWALSRILDSDAVDMIQSPSTYNERGPGGPGGFMPPEGAIRAKGKVLVTESDIRTSHSSSPLGLCRNLHESRSVLEREFGACLAGNVAFRYYDFSLGWVFGDSRLTHLASLFARAEQEILEAEPHILSPENTIAAVISESAMPLFTFKSPLFSILVSHQYRRFTHTGVPFSVYITPGLEAIPTQHRFWFFENPIRMSQQEIDYVKANVLKPGNTVVFAYGANVLTPEGISTEILEELTGMEFKVDFSRRTATAILTAEGQVVLDNPEDASSEEAFEFAPRFHPVDKCRVLARDAEGNIVLAQSEVNGCRVIFATLNDFMSSWIRNLAVQTGLHCYNDNRRDTTWASGDVVTLHTPEGGKRTVRTPRQKGVVRNLVTQEEIPIVNGAFSYIARPLGTDVFLLK